MLLFGIDFYNSSKLYEAVPNWVYIFFFFVVLSAPVAFGANVYDRWTGLYLKNLLHNPSADIFATIDIGLSP